MNKNNDVQWKKIIINTKINELRTAFIELYTNFKWNVLLWQQST